jgi:hypothetical protein
MNDLDTGHLHKHTPPPRPSLVVPVVMVCVFLAGAAVLWAQGWMKGRAACDQFDYHLKVIRQFTAQWPWPNLRDYLSATTPGYHLVMAAVARYVTDRELGLQIAASLFTIAMLGAFGWAVSWLGAARRRSTVELLALALPVVASPYVFTPGVWLLPDNAGWLFAAWVLVLSLRGDVARPWRMAMLSASLLCTVLVRQSHLWVAAPMVTAAWLVPTPEHEGSLSAVLVNASQRVKPLAIALLACIPAIAALAIFMWMWGGLTPPSFQKQHMAAGLSRANWATVPFILSLVTVFSVFFGAHLLPAIGRVWREARDLIYVTAAIGFTWSVIPETTYAFEHRSSGLWNVVKALDDRGIVLGHPAHTSPLIVVLATVGGPLLVAWLTMVEGRRRWVIAAAIAGFMAAQSANANCWQRYHEPFLLILMGLIAAGAKGEMGHRWRFLRVAGPVVLAVLLGVVCVLGLLTGRDPTLPNP